MRGMGGEILRRAGMTYITDRAFADGNVDQSQDVIHRLEIASCQRWATTGIGRMEGCHLAESASARRTCVGCGA